MSTAPTAAQWVAQLRAWKVPFKETKGWRERRRPPETGTWGKAMHGTAAHHDGSRAGTPAALANRVLKYGRADLPGPLCQESIGRRGKVYLIGWGRANHAGAIRPQVLARLINESEPRQPDSTSEETVDGNAHTYGTEVHNNGRGEKYSDRQLLSLVLLEAARCAWHGWTENSVIQHYELTRRKVDMAAVHNNAAGPWLRTEVAVALAAGPGKYTRVGWRPATPPPPAPKPPGPECTHACPAHCPVYFG